MEYSFNPPEHVLTRKIQCGKKCPDGKSRNFLLYFYNGVLILKQKLPYVEDADKGFDKRTLIYDEFLLNGKLYQTRKGDDEHGIVDGKWTITKPAKVRYVSYPISRAIFTKLQIPKDHRIEISDYKPEPVPRRVQPLWGGGMFGPEPWEQ